MINNFAKLRAAAQAGRTMTIAVAAAEDSAVLEAVCEACKEGIVKAILVGDTTKIKAILESLHEDPNAYEMITTASTAESAKIAVSLVREERATCLMKGLLPTGELMRAVIDKQEGIRGSSLMSHVMLYECAAHPTFLVNTDGGLCPYPTLEQKVKILENAARVMQRLGYSKQTAACLCASESVDPKIQSTVEAAEIAAMKEHWQQFGLTVFGPVGLDLAISQEAAVHKGYKAEGVGEADIILVPNYEVGNVLGKSMTYFANAKSGGVIVGAKVPIVLVSRADTAESKLNAIALAAVLAAAEQNEISA